jgi:Transcription initiation factor TFIID component TAF4 family
MQQADRDAEAARLAKRAKRNATANSEADQATANVSMGGPDTPGGMSQESEKKVTKKDRKAAETKFTEQQQHKSANETARMATQGVLGSRFGIGKSKKQYSWLSGGGAAGSPMQTPSKTNTGSPSTSAAATPGNVGPPVVPKSKVFGEWDEDNDPGIQARDVLLVLETDGKAPRSYVRGYSKLES